MADYVSNTLYRNDFGSKPLGTLVYLIKHERIEHILNESEHVLSMNIHTQYKRQMGGDWEVCDGQLNLYQLDGVEGHRFVISLHWDKKWYRKLKKVFGVKTSCVERHNLLNTLCLLEEERRLRNAYSYDTDYMYNTWGQGEDTRTTSTILSNKRIGTIQEEENEDAAEQYSTLTVKPNRSNNDSNPTNEQLTNPETDQEQTEFKSDHSDTQQQQQQQQLSNHIHGDGAAASGSQYSATQSDSEEQVNQNETILEVEVHEENTAAADEKPSITATQNKTLSRKDSEIESTSSREDSNIALTIDEDLREYDEKGVPVLNSKLILNRNQNKLEISSEIEISTDQPTSSSAFKPAPKRPSIRRSISEENNASFTPKFLEPPNSRRQKGSILAKLFSRFKGKSKKRKPEYSQSAKVLSKSMSKLALYETMSLRSTVSVDALSLSSFGPGSTLRNLGKGSYNRRYFKGRPSSMHVLTRDRKFIPIHDVMNCLLEFHDVMRPIKIIGVNSERSHTTDDIADNQIMEVVYFLQKPVNLELRTSRKDYVLYNSVVKLRSFTDTELKIILSN